MTRYIKNPNGGIQSVPDDFEYPTGNDGKPVAGWSEVDPANVPTPLLGLAQDPAVAAAQMHDGAQRAIPEQVSHDPLDLPPTIN